MNRNRNIGNANYFPGADFDNLPFVHSSIGESKSRISVDDANIPPATNAYSYVSNNRVKLIIVLKGNLQLTSMRVVANNRVERIFSLLGQKITHFF